MDGSGDDRITCFKPGGSIGPEGLDILRNVRAQEKFQHGLNDYEEAGLSDDEENPINLEDAEDDEPLILELEELNL